MNALSANETRRAFLDYFVSKGHQEVPSASLIPGNDPTLLFTNAGMIPFKDTFLGLEARPYSRATSSQRCLRVSGKHNDLEEVGISPRHHTLFEMLGNFSFGDYYKREAIGYAWELLTKVLALPVERLWFTVFVGDDEIPGDDEAAHYWEEVGADPDRILRFGRKDNFWVMADTGPCGPNSEITIYIGDDLAQMSAEGVNSEDPDYVEIWNLVFMQFERGTMQPLPKPSIDTGMGFERICMVLQGVHSTYETDLFVPIIERTMALAGGDEQHYREHMAAYRAVADHTRACAFLIADGILPGNAGRSYVLRRLLRRAAYLGRTLGLTKPFLAETAEIVIAQMGDAYPELRMRSAFILETLTGEEERFERTISGGINLLDRALATLPEGAALPGSAAFTLYDTHGFPLDLTEKIVADRGLSVDLAGFEAAMSEQRTRSRGATQFKRGAEAEVWTDQDLPATAFTGYTGFTGSGQILALLAEGDEVSVALEGQRVQVVLDSTPFYAQGGGQVGDTGVLQGSEGRVRVSDAQRPVPGLIVHYGTVEEGIIARGSTVAAQVDEERRRDVMRNHTATHLLHCVAREMLGEHAAQAGSLVAPDRLRFDFTHMRAIPPDELHEMERRINDWIRADTPVDWKVLGYQEAIEQGAMALFGEKYGDQVRMVTAGCEDNGFCSRELCGGTHVARTGEIGLFRILSESSSASGVRRIEAVTGHGAEDWVNQQTAALRDVAARLNTPPTQLLERVDDLLAELKKRQQELDALRAVASRDTLETILSHVRKMQGVSFVAARVEADDAKTLDEMGDRLRDRIGSGVIVLGAIIGGKPQLLILVTRDLNARGFHAGKLVTALAEILGSRGGGRPDRATGGGGDPKRLDTALEQAGDLLATQGSA